MWGQAPLSLLRCFSSPRLSAPPLLSNTLLCSQKREQPTPWAHPLRDGARRESAEEAASPARAEGRRRTAESLH